jgi:hypothetical protein
METICCAGPARLTEWPRSSVSVIAPVVGVAGRVVAVAGMAVLVTGTAVVVGAGAVVAVATDPQAASMISVKSANGNLWYIQMLLQDSFRTCLRIQEEVAF